MELKDKEYLIRVTEFDGLEFDGISFTQNDTNTCRLNFELIEEVDRATIVIDKNDNTQIIDELTHVEGNKYYYDMPISTINVVGTHKAYLMTYGHSDDRRTLGMFKYKITAEPSIEDIATTTEYPLLTKLISDVTALELDIKTSEDIRIQNEGNRVSNENSRIEKEITRDKEFDVIKKDYDTYKNVMIAESNVAALQSQINEHSSSLESIKNDGVIYIDEFNGTDTEKLQQAYDKAITDNRYQTIIINREINIESSIYNNLDNYWDFITIKGEGGIININFGGFLFDSAKNGNGRHAPMFEKIKFVSKDYNNACVFNGDKFIRYNLDGCWFKFVSLIKTDNYIQTLRLLNCEIAELKTDFINSHMCYDVSISQCRFEQHTNNCSAINIKEKKSSMGISYLGLFITNTIFEGYSNATAILLGNGYNLNIKGCYFEANLNNIVIDKGYGTIRTQGSIEDCIFNGVKNGSKTSIILNEVYSTYLNITNNTSNDSYLCNINILKNGAKPNNNMYGGGTLFPQTNIVEVQNIIKNSQQIIKEDPNNAGKVLFKFLTDNFGDTYNNVIGAYLINVEFGFSSANYRGSATILVNVGNVLLNGVITKKIKFTVLNSIATYASNGYVTTDDIKVYWDETQSTETTNNSDIKYISVSVANANVTMISKCAGSMIKMSNLIGLTSTI